MKKTKEILMGLCRKDENMAAEKVLGLESFYLSFTLYSVIYSFMILNKMLITLTFSSLICNIGVIIMMSNLYKYVHIYLYILHTYIHEHI